jgi:protein-disulfide isomerase
MTPNMNEQFTVVDLRKQNRMMTYKFSIFSIFILLAMIEGAGIANPALPEQNPPQAIASPFNGFEASIGSIHAPLTIIMYYSLTCPHCHDFQETVMPQIQKEYIDKKLVRFIFRDFPTDGLALKAAKIAWCLGKDHYIRSAKKLLATQDKWANPDDTDKALHQIALGLGISSQDFEKCLNKKEVEDTIVRTSFEAQKDYQLTGAPAFIVNGKVFDDSLTVEAIHDLLIKMGIHS